MPANILVRHMSLGVSAKKISHTCMPYLLKEAALRSYHYIGLFLSALPHIFRWTTQPATKAQLKEKARGLLMFMNFHDVNRDNLGTFENSVCNYLAGARVMQQLSVWADLGCCCEQSLGWAVRGGTSAGGSVPSPCPGLLKQPFSLSSPEGQLSDEIAEC